ncbi:MAG TPA: hypothetical protein VKB88_03450 [Bryobacteraceae bacterium]|nr:hypothetical protein [Bryobacteraceae bacterium]
MRHQSFRFLISCGLLALPVVAAGHGSCNLDVPLEWTIASTYVDGTTPNLIGSDGSPYLNGQSGVAATIKVCDGTNDAVLQLESIARSFSVSFTRALATNGNTPSWASGSVSGQGILNIRNITFVPSGGTRADEYTFTTRMGSQLPVKGSWNFRMWNPSTQAVSGVDNWVTAANTPLTDSLVNVHHCPAQSTAAAGPCAGIVHETWFVSADAAGTGTSTQTGLPLTQVGGLQNTQTSQPVIAGQFSVPFSFTISTLQ